MRISDLRHRLTLQTLSGTTSFDSRGQSQLVWTDVKTNVPAKIEQLSGRELERARQQVATATHRVTSRYLSSVTVGKRWKFGTRVFSIEQVDDQRELRREQVAICTEEL